MKHTVDASGEPPADDLKRCALCGWTLATKPVLGCVPGNCSMRPSPSRFYSPVRAKAEYAPHLDNDPRCAAAAAAVPSDSAVRLLARRWRENGGRLILLKYAANELEAALDESTALPPSTVANADIAENIERNAIASPAGDTERGR
jgi:hypothetical protein